MLDPKVIRRLVRIMVDSGVTELELDDATDGFRLRLKRGGDEPQAAAPVVHVLSGGMPAAAPVPGQAPGAAPAAPSGPPAGMVEIPSPMVGTFYRSSSPDSEPYVEEGTRIGEDTVVCIIEAMKVMNEIKAELGGVVAEILVENGEPVEFGQPLFLVRKG